MASKDVLVTVALIVQNVDTILEKNLALINALSKKNYQYYEILLIDNGSQNFSYEKIQKKFSHLRILLLSRPFPSEITQLAALENSIGDYVVVLDPLEDPPEIIASLVNESVKGNDIVLGLERGTKKNPLVSFIIKLVFKKDLDYHPTNCFALSRKAVNALLKFKNQSLSLKYLSSIIGFRQSVIYYKKIKAGKISLFKKVFSLVDLIVGNSTFPLKAAAFLGMLASFLSLSYLGYVLVISLVKNKIAEGWITTSVVSGTMFFLLFLILVILAQYIDRLLAESKDQPRYFISEELNSQTVALKRNKRNVV